MLGVVCAPPSPLASHPRLGLLHARLRSAVVRQLPGALSDLVASSSANEQLLISSSPRTRNSKIQKLEPAARALHARAEVSGSEAPAAADVESLREKWGCQNLRFSVAAGVRVAQLSISDGSACTVLIDGACVSSYRAAQWHGGQEDVLFAREAEELPNVGGTQDPEGTWEVVQGGLVINFPAFGGLRLGKQVAPLAQLAGKATWQVTNASVNSCAENVTSVQLTLSSQGSHSDVSNVQTHFWALQHTLTLSATGLKAELSVTNTGLHPVHVAPSVIAHMAVADLDGCFLMGCTGHEYLADEVAVTRRAASFGEALSGWWQGLTGARSLGDGATDVGTSPPPDPPQQDLDAFVAGGTPRMELLWDSLGSSQRARAAAQEKPEPESLESASPSLANERTNQGLSRLCQGREEREYADLQEGVCRLFPSGPQSVTLVDRGARRSFLLTTRSFPDFFVENCGSSSNMEDWSKFAAIGFGFGSKPLELGSRETWAGNLFIQNLGRPD